MKKYFLFFLILSGLFIMVGCSQGLPTDYQDAVEAYESNIEFKEWFLKKKNDVDNIWLEEQSVMGVEVLDNLLTRQDFDNNTQSTYFNHLGINYIARKENGIIKYNDKNGHKYSFENDDEFILWYAYQVFIGAELPALNDYTK